METIRIPNRATRFPVALSDVFLAAPFASRVLFRSSLPGSLVGAAAIGAYAGSAARDWLSRRGVRALDFRRTFGLDPLKPPAMSSAAREAEIAELTVRLNALYRQSCSTRSERALSSDRALTEFIARYTGQRVLTSVKVRSFMLPKLFFPFAVGACDVISGEVGIFRDVGIFEPHVLAHEFAHRKGYFREVEAQLLAYLSLAGSSWPEGVLSALSERLYRNVSVVGGRSARRSRAILEGLGLRAELESAFLMRCGVSQGVERAVSPALERLYDLRMRLTGQNGLTDYDEGFTNSLHFLETRLPGSGDSTSG